MRSVVWTLKFSENGTDWICIKGYVGFIMDDKQVNVRVWEGE